MPPRVADTRALWYVIPHAHRHAAAALWEAESGLPNALSLDGVFLGPAALAGAPFPVHVHEQVVGDCVLLPSDTPHQVVNEGAGVSVKVSWNRVSASSLAQFLGETMDVYQRYGKPEVYRTKATAHFALKHTTRRLRELLQTVHAEGAGALHALEPRAAYQDLLARHTLLYTLNRNLFADDLIEDVDEADIDAQRAGGADELLDEVASGCLSSLGGEGAGQQAGDAVLSEDELLMARATKQLGRGAGAQNLRRVGIKGHDDCRAVVLRSVFLGGADDFLVPEVNAIKHADGEGEGTVKSGKGVDGAKDLHAWER